jgi:hypothetical protein
MSFVQSYKGDLRAVEVVQLDRGVPGTSARSPNLLQGVGVWAGHGTREQHPAKFRSSLIKNPRQKQQQQQQQQQQQ